MTIFEKLTNYGHFINSDRCYAKNASNADAESFTSSIDVDKDLYNFDILGSIAHVEMLSQQKIISVKWVTKKQR